MNHVKAFNQSVKDLQLLSFNDQWRYIRLENSVKASENSFGNQNKPQLETNLSLVLRMNKHEQS